MSQPSYLRPYTPLQREIAARARKFIRDLAAETQQPAHQVDWDPNLGIEHWVCGPLTVQFRNDPDTELKVTSAVDRHRLRGVLQYRLEQAYKEIANKTLSEKERHRQREFFTCLNAQLVDAMVGWTAELKHLGRGHVLMDVDSVDASLTVYLKPDPQEGDTHSDWRVRIVVGNWT